MPHRRAGEKRGSDATLARMLGIGLLLTVLLGGWIYLVWPTDARRELAEKQEQREEKPIQIHQVSIYDSRENGLRLEAESAKIYPDKGQLYFTNLIGKGAAKTGEAGLRLEAKTAKMSKVTGLVTAQGGVMIRMPSGKIVRTEKLTYNKQKGIIRGKDPVTVTGTPDSLKGTGMRYDVAKETLEIFHPQIILHGL